MIDPTQGLTVYRVGGAVRDALLGLPAGDQDWVVVGATPEQMVQRGFIPVGGDFPVFLHPHTHEEYALARTERKSGRGYHGFTFYTGTDVTLEQDLMRRDLTVNAMAMTDEGQLVDPLNGQADLTARVFRHIGQAFAEDPVRILRLARFLARFTTFTVATETLALCQAMVQSGEVDALVPERVWQEISKGLLAEQPSRLFAFLQACGASRVIMPEWVATDRVMTCLDQLHAVKTSTSHFSVIPDLAAHFAVGVLDSPERELLCQRLRVPRDVRDMAKLLAHVVHSITDLTQHPIEHHAQMRLALIEYCDAFRKPARFIMLIELAAWLTQASTHPWRVALEHAQAVDAGAIARQMGRDSERIRQAVRAARLKAIQG